MTVLSDNTKVTRVDAAFATLVAEMMKEGQNKQARNVLSAFEELHPASKLKLFDILTKPD